MEDDNALDIIKWLFREDTKLDLSGRLFMYNAGERSEWDVSLFPNSGQLTPRRTCAATCSR